MCSKKLFQEEIPRYNGSGEVLEMQHLHISMSNSNNNNNMKDGYSAEISIYFMIIVLSYQMLETHYSLFLMWVKGKRITPWQTCFSTSFPSAFGHALVRLVSTMMTYLITDSCQFEFCIYISWTGKYESYANLPTFQLYNLSLSVCMPYDSFNKIHPSHFYVHHVTSCALWLRGHP